MLNLNTAHGTILGISGNGSKFDRLIVGVDRMTRIRLHLGKRHLLCCAAGKTTPAVDAGAAAPLSDPSELRPRQMRPMSGRAVPGGPQAAFPAEFELPARAWATLVITRAVSL